MRYFNEKITPVRGRFILLFCAQSINKLLYLRRKIYILIIFLSVLAFIESSIPYYYASNRCGNDKVFLGQIISTFDQNMYFSFTRQARNGHILFNNRLTYISNPAVFFNLEFLGVGMLQRLTGMDENAVYSVWRFAGVVVLSISFVLLADLVLKDFLIVVLSSILFLFSGGIGFVRSFLNIAGLRNLFTGTGSIFGNSVPPNLAMDTSTYLLPINQEIANPHFSLPTGIFILACYYYLRALMQKQEKYFYYSLILFLVTGFVRPYDILPVLVIFPLFYLATCKTRGFDKNFLLSMTPVWGVLLPFAYNIWLFRFNKIFSQWSVQGDNSYIIPSFPVHLLNFGIMGLMLIIRLIWIKKQPLKVPEVFFLITVAVTLCINHIGKYSAIIPWSFQVGGYVAAPIVLLGFGFDYQAISRKKIFRGIVFSGIMFLILVSNLALVSFRCKLLSDPANRTHMYASREEFDSWKWLQKNTKPGEVVLSSAYTCSRIAKYTDLSVVAGHPTVSPFYKATVEIAKKIVFDSTLPFRYRDELKFLNVDYIYIGAEERLTNPGKIGNTDYLSEIYNNKGVSIYKIRKS